MFGRRPALEVAGALSVLKEGMAKEATEPYPFVFFNAEDPKERFGFDRYKGARERVEESLREYYEADDDEDEDYYSEGVLSEIQYCKALNKMCKYLTSARAVRTPVEVYALWVDLHVQQGGEVNFYERNFVDLDNAWMPTRSESTRMPDTYGASSVHVLLLPGMGTRDMMDTDLSAHGHSEVHWFEEGDSKMPVVWSNAYRAQTYTDVENLRKSLSSKELAKRALDIMAQARAL